MGFYLLSLVFLAIGIGMIAMACSTEQRPVPPQWEKTVGAIGQVSFEEISDEEEGTKWKVAPTYAYVVEETTYVEFTLAENYQGSSNRAVEEQLYDKLRSGERVTVYYNPADPTVSILTWQNDPSARILLYWGSLMIIVAVGMSLQTWLSGLSDPALVESIRVFPDRPCLRNLPAARQSNRISNPFLPHQTCQLP